jgi:plasmid stabilization system protein ParE
MKFEFHPEALEEYKDAARYYEECQSSLGHRFIAAVEQAILHITEKPEQWKILEEDVRRHLTRVFPYAILYTIESDYILIIAVMHCNRKPGYWKNRIT